MSTQTSQKVIHLNRYYHFTELMRDPSIEGEFLRYESAHDGTMQTTFVLRPAGRRSDKLFFFFHGMDGDCGDGVVVRDLVKHLNATVVAMGGRGPAWVSTPFLADAEQVIRTHAQGFPNYYLIGVSMGGTQVLTLGALLPDKLRRLMLGIIALIPGVNLPAILAQSSNERVKNTLRASVDGDAFTLRERSPAQILDRYKEGLPFVVFYNHEDTLLLSDELKEFIADLRRRRHPVTTFSAPGGHDFTYQNFDYETVVGRLGTDSTEDAPPLISDGRTMTADPEITKQTFEK
jgi:pimeloyl-ACP methyl ester carboxylesterase